MAKVFIKELKLNDLVESIFVVKQKQINTTKTGNSYVILKLADRTGEIEARMWDNFADIFEKLTEGTYLRVTAAVSEYNGRPQVTLKKAAIADPNEYDLADFIRHTKKNIEETFKNLLAVIATINDPDLKKLLNEFFSDAEFVKKFKKAPAAMNMHSACIGGLLEHVDNLVQLALFVAAQYPEVNRDLLLTGAILHDMGKTTELEYEHVFKYSDPGKLIGHINIGVQMLNEKIAKIAGFPAEKKMLLEHLLLSHHGEPDFGSPRQPMTLEAVALHQLDNLEAKLTGFSDFVELNRQPNSAWTPRAFMFDNRELYLGKK